MVCIMNLGWTCRSPKAPTSSWLVWVSCWLLGVMQRDRGSAGCNGSYDVKAYHGRQRISRTPLSEARWRGAEAPPLLSCFFLVFLSRSLYPFQYFFRSLCNSSTSRQRRSGWRRACRSNASPLSPLPLSSLHE